jgi:ketosteroid isomerase-like protein
MTTEANKQVVKQFFARLDANDTPGALAIVADDATWWLAGKRELLPSAGSYDKTRLTELFRTMDSRLTGGLRMTIKSVIAEGDRVAVETESHGKLRNGRSYNNEYVFVITVRAGKIAAVREYNDTHHAFATFFQR